MTQNTQARNPTTMPEMATLTVMASAWTIIFTFFLPHG
jgi:hypothetical protein